MEEKQRKPAVAEDHAAFLAILSHNQLQIKQHFTILN